MKPTRKRDIFRPNAILDTIFEITPEFMQARHLRALLLDLDNTLIPYKSFEEAPHVIGWATALLESGIQMRILSNALPKRVEFWCHRLNFPGVGLASKPFPKAFRQAIEELGVQSKHVAMVGDQLFTDILGGNLAGAFTIMVRPLSENALPHTRLARKMERFVLKKLDLHSP